MTNKELEVEVTKLRAEVKALRKELELTRSTAVAGQTVYHIHTHQFPQPFSPAPNPWPLPEIICGQRTTP